MARPVRRRRRRWRKKIALQPLTPEAHAVRIAERAQWSARQKALRKLWAAEDAMTRTAAQLEGERRQHLRRNDPRECARELTEQSRPFPIMARSKGWQF